jgi:hypothetical protein
MAAFAAGDDQLGDDGSERRIDPSPATGRSRSFPSEEQRQERPTKHRGYCSRGHASPAPKALYFQVVGVPADGLSVYRGTVLQSTATRTLSRHACRAARLSWLRTVFMGGALRRAIHRP